MITSLLVALVYIAVVAVIGYVIIALLRMLPGGLPQPLVIIVSAVVVIVCLIILLNAISGEIPQLE